MTEKLQPSFFDHEIRFLPDWFELDICVELTELVTELCDDVVEELGLNSLEVDISEVKCEYT